MAGGARCVGVAALLVVGALAAPSGADAPHVGVSRVTLASGVAQSASRRCGGCHSPEFALWIRHSHSHFLVDPATDRRFVAARFGEGVPGWGEHVEGRFRGEDVALAYGLLDVQVYFRRDPDGHRLLPAEWNHHEDRWEALRPSLAEVVESRLTWEDGCAGCHTTGFDPRDGTFEEANAGCAACHGPGQAHVEAGGRGPILDPTNLEPRRRSEVCGACHARGRDRATGRPYPVGFHPGDPLDRVLEVGRPEPGVVTELFWGDGTERLPFMEYQGFVQSGHYRVGLTCTTCHLPHGSEHPRSLRRRTDDVCDDCHGEVLAAVRAHTAHPEGKADCLDCHMAALSGGSGLARTRSHTFRFRPPASASTQRAPDSCTVSCHGDRGPAWAAEALGAWR